MALQNKEMSKVEIDDQYRAYLIKHIQSISPPHQKYLLPAIISIFIPGLGQIIKGEIGKGIIFFLFMLIGYIVFFGIGLLIHIYIIIDAYSDR